MQGARRVDAETYEVYVAGSLPLAALAGGKVGTAADGPFSVAVTGEGRSPPTERSEHGGGPERQDPESLHVNRGLPYCASA